MLSFAEQTNREYEAELYGQQAAPEKLTVLVVEPMKEPYVKEIAPGLHALQAEVGGDIAASYPFDDPVGLVLNDEGKLIGLDLNRSLRDEHGEIYDIVAGTFLVVGLGPESLSLIHIAAGSLSYASWLPSSISSSSGSAAASASIIPSGRVMRPLA